MPHVSYSFTTAAVVSMLVLLCLVVVDVDVRCHASTNHTLSLETVGTSALLQALSVLSTASRIQVQHGQS